MNTNVTKSDFISTLQGLPFGEEHAIWTVFNGAIDHELGTMMQDGGVLALLKFMGEEPEPAPNKRVVKAANVQDRPKPARAKPRKTAPPAPVQNPEEAKDRICRILMDAGASLTIGAIVDKLGIGAVQTRALLD